MKKQSVLISWRGVVIALSAAAVLMAVGSFVDYQLSCALYNEKNGSPCSLPLTVKRLLRSGL